MENKIPTAHQFIRDAPYLDSTANLMKEFAKLHVKAALEAASQNADAYNKPKFKGDINPVVDLDSILNSYPLENIK